MGVTIKPKGSDNDINTELLTNLGQALSLINYSNALKAAHCVAVIKPKRLVIERNEEQIAELAINTELFPMLLGGKIVADSLQVVRNKIEGLFKEACQKVGQDPDDYANDSALPEPTQVSAPKKKAAGKAKVTKVTKEPDGEQEDPIGDLLPAAKKKAGPAENPSVAGIQYETNLAAKPCYLGAAQKLHHPVFATSGGSRYHVVALGDGLNVAARLICGGESDSAAFKLSVRVEGDKLSDHKQKLVNAGFSINGGYASIHVEHGSGGKTLLLKTLGALVMALDLSGLVAGNNQKLINQGA